MRTNNTLVAILLLFLIIGCADQKPTSVKIMTWNIWHGGLHGDKASDFKKDTANTENVLKVLVEESPDILFMQETYCCGMEIARQAGYKYSFRGSSNLSIHSKYPIIDSIRLFRDFNSHAAVIDVDGQHLLCINIWLHYLPAYFLDIMELSVDSLIAGEGTTRLREITAILHSVDSLEKLLNLPMIIGGDFNSGSHLDWVEETREFHYNKVVEWPVSILMLGSGYIDSFREANPDPTQTLEGTWGFLSDEIISDRIDFIYYQGDNIKTRNSKIVMDDPSGGFFNSDHRAILSIFDIEN